MSLSKGVTFTISLIVVIAVAIAATAVLRLRDYKVDSLYSDLTAVPHSPEEEIDFVLKIAKFPTANATRKLVLISEAELNMRDGIIFPGTSIVAIKSLHGRGGAEVTDSLARLIQPHKGLIVRQAAADEVLTRECVGDCMLQIMHYLEREMYGATAMEKQEAGDLDYLLDRARTELHTTLVKIVKQNSGSAIAVLQEVYGLGAMSTSDFALEIAPAADLKESCPYLTESAQLGRRLVRSSEPKLTAVMQSLSCASTPQVTSAGPRAAER
jgi:hypothetical protein